jgi:repressor LexA
MNEVIMAKTIVAERIRILRENAGLSQGKLANIFEIDQPAVYRYESGNSFPPFAVLLKYADRFDVSLDYIFGRTDQPQGKLYHYEPDLIDDNADLKEFIDMCMDPKSPANAKLKQALLKILEEKRK